MESSQSTWLLKRVWDAYLRWLLSWASVTPKLRMQDEESRRLMTRVWWLLNWVQLVRKTLQLSWGDSSSESGRLHLSLGDSWTESGWLLNWVGVTLELSRGGLLNWVGGDSWTESGWLLKWVTVDSWNEALWLLKWVTVTPETSHCDSWNESLWLLK